MPSSSSSSSSTSPERNLYDILGTKPNATPVAIRKAYKKAMLKTHPDKNRHRGGSPSAFIAVQKAYKILGDESSRRRYDAQLKAKQFQKRARGGGGISSSSSYSSYSSNFVKKWNATSSSEKNQKDVPSKKPYVGIRIAIMLDGRWVKGFLKAYEERSTKSVRSSERSLSIYTYPNSLTGGVC